MKEHRPFDQIITFSTTLQHRTLLQLQMSEGGYKNMSEFMRDITGYKDDLSEQMNMIFRNHKQHTGPVASAQVPDQFIEALYDISNTTGQNFAQIIMRSLKTRYPEHMRKKGL